MGYSNLNEAFPDPAGYFNNTNPNPSNKWDVGFEANGSLKRIRSSVKPEDNVHFMSEVIHPSPNRRDTSSITGYDMGGLNLSSSAPSHVNFDIYNQNHYGPSRSNSNNTGLVNTNFHLSKDLSSQLKKDTDAISCQDCFSHLNNCNSCRNNALQMLSSMPNNANFEGFSNVPHQNNPSKDELKKKVDRMERAIELVLFVGIGFALSNIFNK